MIELENIKIHYPIHRGIFNRVVGNVRAVDGVSMSVSAGETLGVVGESGCGKTTLGRGILGLERLTGGRVLYEGRDVSEFRGEELKRYHRSCQMVFQDPFSTLNPRMPILDIVGEGMLWHGLCKRGEVKERVAGLLEEVGLNGDSLYKYPHEFSGGQRQRISIARALSLEPRFIICDEPVSALDVSVQAQVLNLMMDLRERRGLSYLFISHDLSVVKHVSQKIAVMYLGRVVEYGEKKEILENPRHPYTRALLSAVPQPGVRISERIVLKGEQPSPANPPGGCSFHPRCPYATERCRSEVPQLTGEGRSCACFAAVP